MLSKTLQTNPWFFPITHNQETSKIRLFTFHHAGGTASMFRPWAKLLNSQVEIVGIQYPGRENRFMESPLRDLQSLVESLIQAFSSCFEKPFVFLVTV